MAGEVPRYEMQAPSLRQVPRYNPFDAVPVSPVDTSVAEVQSQAAAGLAEVSDTVGKILDARVKQEAELAGEKVGMDPAFAADQLPGNDAWTVAGQAYRAGAANSFLARLELDRATRFDELGTEYLQTPENQRNPQQYADSMRAWIEGTANTLPADMQLDFRKQSYAKMLPLAQSALSEHLTYQETVNKADADANIKNLYTQAQLKAYPKTKEEQLDFDVTMAQLHAAIDNSVTLTPNQKLLAKTLYTAGVQEATVNAVKQEQIQRQELIKQTVEQRSLSYQKLFAEVPDAKKLDYLKRFESADPYQMGFASIEERNSVFNILKADFEHKQWITHEEKQKLTDAEKIQYSFMDKELNDRVAEGKSSPSEILDYQAKGIITPARAGSLLHSLKTGNEKRAREAASISAIKSGAHIDLTDTKQVDLLDKAAEQMMTGQSGSYDRVMPVVGTVTSKFGFRAKPMAGASSMHRGVDIGAPLGSPVVAPIDGEVLAVHTGNKGASAGYGNLLEIEGADGKIYRFGHMRASDIVVKPGDRVSTGQRIGKVGSEGRSTGPHIHYEVLENGVAVDPTGVHGKRKVSVSPEQGFNAVVQMAMSQHRAPKVLVNSLLQGLHGKPEQQVQAAQLVYKLKTGNVDIPGLSQDDEDYALKVVDYATKGYQPQQIVEKLGGMRDPLRKGQNQVLDQNFERAFKEKGRWKQGFDPVELLNDNGWFTPKSGISSRALGDIQVEYENKLQEYYRRSDGDVNMAKERALQDLKQTWGTTWVGGSPRLIKRPPEVVYRMDSNHISHQLDAAIGSKRSAYRQVFVDEPIYNANAKRWIYPVFGVLQNGQIEAVKDGKGKPMLFWPDRSQSTDKQKQVLQQRQQAAKQGPVSVYSGGAPMNMLGK